MFIFLEYVAELYKTLIETPRRELQQLEDELTQGTPQPMQTMFELESREEAVQKHKSRKEKTNVECPPTCSGK